MKAVVKVLLLILTVCGIASCATTGVKFSEMNVAKASQDPGQGRIFIYRPSSLGAAIRPDILLNNEKVGEAISWGFFYVDRPPGEYTVVTSTEVTRKCSFTLDKGQTRYIRMAVSMGFFAGHVYGELVDEAVGIEELKGCRYIGK
jgi:hypothetical protein